MVDNDWTYLHKATVSDEWAGACNLKATSITENKATKLGVFANYGIIETTFSQLLEYQI